MYCCHSTYISVGKGKKRQVQIHRCGRNTSRWLELDKSDRAAVDVYTDEDTELGYGNLAAVLGNKEVFIYKTNLEAQVDAGNEVTVCYNYEETFIA